MGFFSKISKGFSPLLKGVADSYTGGLASKVLSASKSAARKTVSTPRAASAGAQLMSSGGGGGASFTSGPQGDIAPNAADAYVNFMEAYFQSAGYTPLIKKAWRKVTAAGGKKDGFVMWLSSRTGEMYNEGLKLAVVNDLESSIWKVRRRRAGGLTKSQKRALRTVAAIKKLVHVAQTAPRLAKKKSPFGR